MHPPSSAGPEPAIRAAAPARQRWRLVLGRAASQEALGGRELADAWDAAAEASGLPLHRPAGKSRGRVTFGAPVPAVIALERELAELVLIELVPRWQVRDALEGVLPEGWRLIDLFDVWLGEPPLAGQVAAADYRVELEGADAAAIADAASRLRAASTLPRERTRSGDVVRYDLRPLLIDVVVSDPGPPVVIRTRTRFHPALGTGRPEEVVAALGDGLQDELVPRSIARERIILAIELTHPREKVG